MTQTELTVFKIKALKKEVEEIEKNELEIINLHPNLSYIVMEKIKQKLCQKGWIVINYMIPYESYHGYGIKLVKSKLELTNFDKRFLAKHHNGIIF